MWCLHCQKDTRECDLHGKGMLRCEHCGSALDGAPVPIEDDAPLPLAHDAVPPAAFAQAEVASDVSHAADSPLADVAMTAAAGPADDAQDGSAAESLKSQVLLAESPTPIEIVEAGDASEDNARSAKLDPGDKSGPMGPHFDAPRARSRLHDAQQALRRAAAWENAGRSPDFQEIEPEEQSPAAQRRLLHVDAPHARLRGRHKPRRKHKTRRSSPLVWLCVCAGCAATVFGLVVAGFGFLDGRADLWRLGLPVALAGQAAMALGLLIPLFLRRQSAPPDENRPHKPKLHRPASAPPWSRSTRRALRRHIDRPA